MLLMFSIGKILNFYLNSIYMIVQLTSYFVSEIEDERELSHKMREEVKVHKARNKDLQEKNHTLVKEQLEREAQLEDGISKVTLEAKVSTHVTVLQICIQVVEDIEGGNQES